MPKRPPYQDIWRNGQLVTKGRRECSRRFDLISSAVGDVGSLADVGGWDGYFARRFAESGVERVTLVEQRAVPDVDAIEHLRITVDATNVETVGRHDAILALAVLHHMPDWQHVYERFRALSRTLVAEVAHPDEVADGRPLTPTLIETRPRIPGIYERLLDDGEVVGWTSGPNGVDRPIVQVRNTVTGSVESGSGLAAPYMAEVNEGHWDALGYRPQPGTLNVNVGRAGKSWTKKLPGPVERSADKLPGPYWPVTVNGIEGHVRLSRSRTAVELVAPVNLRDELNLTNGDEVEIAVR